MGDLPQHRFDLVIDGEKRGGAEVEYFSKPIPLYQLSELYVDFEYKGLGYASMIMEKVEEFLRKRKKPGILTDAIIQGDPASGMYKKRGWIEVPNALGLYVYNWPDNISFDILAGYEFRQTDYLQRQGNKK